jgi:hypothetical protein
MDINKLKLDVELCSNSFLARKINKNMKAEEILKEWLIQTDQTNLKEGHYFVIKEAMKEFAELKCKELLEIVAKKVKIEVVPEGLNKRSIDVYESYERGGHGEPNWCTKISVDKDSILNAVDLKEFIK